MILDWIAQTPALLVGVLVVFVPGVLALWGVGLRGLPLLAAAPLFGTATVGFAALGAGLLGIPWSPLTWAIGAVLLVVIAWVIGRLLGNRLPRPAGSGSPRWLMPTALSIGIVIGAARLITFIADPEAISQTNDAVFHMNAVRFALETGNASALHISAVVGGTGFYPAAWHDIVTLIVLMSGASIPVAANMLTLLIGAVMWPLGIAWMTTEITASARIAAFAAVLSGALQTFPLLMFQWGVLFPNALSTALIPAGVAVVVAVRRWSQGGDRVRAIVRSLLLVLVVIGALLLAQPAALLPWAAISLIWLTFQVLRRRDGRSAAPAIVAVAVAWVALAGVWFVMSQGTSGSHWAPFRGKLQAALDVVLNGQVMIPFALGISALMLVGLVVAVRRASFRWLVVAWLAMSLLYVLAASVGNPLVRNVVLGAWYADPYRIAALAPIAVIPLAAIGLDAIVTAVARWTRRPQDSRAAAVVGLVAATLFMIAITVLRPVEMPRITEDSFFPGSTYDENGSEAYLDADERAMLESLDELVEEGVVVLGNPSTGSGFGYFLSGVDVYPRTWSPPTQPQWQVLANGLSDAAELPEVCDALDYFGSAEYVLDFGPGEVDPGRYVMPGMTGFEEHDGFEFVAEEGDVSLWRITACAP
ncbi:DUF6541 family protein [Microbacterium sp. NPDC056234]|uniref:DUF6541 family protein n=1 Tax=Microbacterium sp. NPDC056234 TaxID=3345757 RepID=UPI0035D74BD6